MESKIRIKPKNMEKIKNKSLEKILLQEEVEVKRE